MMHSVITVVKRLLEKYHLATQPQESASSSTVISAVPEAPNAEAGGGQVLGYPLFIMVCVICLMWLLKNRNNLKIG